MRKSDSEVIGEINDLVAELENIIELIEDGYLVKASEELECQSGTISTLLENWESEE